MALIQMALPIVVILAFVVFKLNHNQKGLFFKVPVWISSTAISLIVGHAASGVMGFYAAAFSDLLLFPLLLLVKKAWERKDAKLKGQGSRSRALALPGIALVAS